MICEKCGQELKEGVKFCTKCGTSFKKTIGFMPTNMALPIISIILFLFGIIISYCISPIIGNNGDWKTGYIIYIIVNIINQTSIIVALLSLYKQKSLTGFIAGLIPSAYFIIMRIIELLANLKHF